MVILDNSRTLGAFERQSRIFRLWKQQLKLHLILQKGFNVILLLKTIQNISMTLQALLASNAYGTHLPMILKHALAKPQS